jgi:hypothetical protein
MNENIAPAKALKEMNIKGSSTDIELEHFIRKKLDDPLFNTILCANQSENLKVKSWLLAACLLSTLGCTFNCELKSLIRIFICIGGDGSRAKGRIVLAVGRKQLLGLL